MDKVAHKHILECLMKVNVLVALLCDLFEPHRGAGFHLVFEDLKHVNESLLVKGMRARFSLGSPIIVYSCVKERVSKDWSEWACHGTSFVINCILGHEQVLDGVRARD